MKKKITLLAIFILAFVLIGGGCQKKESDSNQPVENQVQEQEQKNTDSGDETTSDEPVTDNTDSAEVTEEPAFIDIEADREEGERIREQQKNCQQYSWSAMKEGPYRDKISYALSSDLINWTDSEQVLAEHASVPGAIIKDDTIYVYYVDVSQECYPEKLDIIMSSDDGQSWSSPVTVYIKGLGTKVAVDPSPYLLEDGRIRLYYFDINGDKNPKANFKIYSAVSEDGMNFIEEEGVRFSNPGTLDPDVIKVGDAWKLYTGSVENSSTVLATSSDGLNFTYEGVAFSGGAVPDVFYKDGTYYLYTAGIDIATSKDGVNFTKTDGHFQSKIGVITADPSVVELSNGTYLMMYKANEGRN